MLHKSILLVLCAVSLQAAWYDNLDLKVEAGMYFNDFDGELSNPDSVIDYRDDLGYQDTDSSYFGVQLRSDYSYMPHMELSYMNTSQEKDTSLDVNRTVEIATKDHSGDITSSIDYEVLDLLLYQSFAYEGQMKEFFSWDYYTGDIEFNAGMHVKNIGHSFKIISQDVNQNKTRDVISYVDVNSNIVMPYFGLTYYWYKWRVHADASALSLSEAKARDYSVGIDYRLIEGLFLSASYMYKEFQATEVKDKVDFSTYGTKFSFKYRF